MLSFEINNMEYKINWFLENTYDYEWEGNDHWRLEPSDPELAQAKDNYVTLKNKIEEINEIIPLNLTRDIDQFKASLWHYIAEIVKYEMRKKGDRSIMNG